ncbi:MAG: KH domain-containing protein [bacterium]
MKELLEFVLKQIVNNPKAIKVEEEIEPDDPTFVKLLITADEEDRGLIIGKAGSNISALRNLISIKAVQENKKVKLEIVD